MGYRVPFTIDAVILFNEMLCSMMISINFAILDLNN
jgi:hypothetical protein